MGPLAVAAAERATRALLVREEGDRLLLRDQAIDASLGTENGVSADGRVAERMTQVQDCQSTTQERALRVSGRS